MPADIRKARNKTMSIEGTMLPASKHETTKRDTHAWWKDTVFYELYVDRFAGTFLRLTQKLSYIKALGVGCVYILPHYPSPMIDDGYDVSDYYAVRKDLGTLKDFDVFVAEAHRQGMRVMIDLVLNHVSTQHPWFIEARSSLNNPKRDFFLWSKAGKEYANAANPFSNLKPANWIYNEQSHDFYFSTFYPEQADLNWNNPAVFSEMMHVVDFWIARGVDGFRLDAVPHLIKKGGTSSRSLPETHAVLKKIRAHLDAVDPEVALLAEAHEPIGVLKEYFGDGDECQLVYHFPLAEYIFVAMIRKDDSIIQRISVASQGIPEQCQWVTFLTMHDEISLATFDDITREEILSYLDPRGKHRFNKGVSLRLATLCHGDKEKIINLFKTLFNVPGSPLIYYGAEIGMENIPLVSGEKDTRRAVRGTFDWTEAEKQMDDPSSLFSVVARMLKERRQKNQVVTHLL